MVVLEGQAAVSSLQKSASAFAPEEIREHAMRNAVLFTAMSLDGYLADSTGSVDWLSGHDSSVDSADTYQAFVQTVDTAIMGYNTYHQIVTELSPDVWVYDMLKTYVITHRPLPSGNAIQFCSTNPCELLTRLKGQPGKDIWICGGAQIVSQLLRQNMIDIYYISVIPTLLGSGIRLFEKAENEIKLHLTKLQQNNGIVDLIYERRQPPI